MRRMQAGPSSGFPASLVTPGWPPATPVQLLLAVAQSRPLPAALGWPEHQGMGAPGCLPEGRTHVALLAFSLLTPVQP
jgi:hypothetical protein